MAGGLEEAEEEEEENLEELQNVVKGECVKEVAPMEDEKARVES